MSVSHSDPEFDTRDRNERRHSFFEVGPDQKQNMASEHWQAGKDACMRACMNTITFPSSLRFSSPPPAFTNLSSTFSSPFH
jgi:hypothetical protein